MGFFDPPPPEPPAPQPQRYRYPAWFGPPENVLPGVLALELLLVKTERVCAWIGGGEVYPSGLMLEVTIRGRNPAQADVESGEGGWRFGIQFPDGRKASSYGLGAFARLGHGQAARSSRAFVARRGDAPPDPPLLSPRGGGGSRRNWRQEYWLWPLPPRGELVIACEWPNVNVELSTATIGADRLREAAERARELWPDEDLPEWPG